MYRRTLLGGIAAAAFAFRTHPGTAADNPAPKDAPYDAQTVKNQARTLAAAPFKAPDDRLPDSIAKLGYDEYRNIRFDPGQSLWRGAKLPFEVQFFHRGWLYAPRVDLFDVANGRATPIAYRPEMFDFGPLPRPAERDLGFAGFRLHAPINRPDYADEVVAFLGASYFRAVGRNLTYGLSARALALNTADPAGEEFPAFRAFWLERPQPGTNSIVITALLDSPSTAAAMRMAIRPGEDTVMDIELTLFPRVDLTQPGIAVGTSMFLFDTSNRAGPDGWKDDWRPAVHDSDGLMMQTGRGEELFRQLANPRTLQLSSFSDSAPRGFGLVQRQRALSNYQDLEARYEKRPSLWVEPIGDWGEGAIHLVEIPTKQEINDNIVAFWRPKGPLHAKAEHGFTYRLHWCPTPPIQSDLARFGQTRTGNAKGGRVFVLQATGGKLKGLSPETQLQARITTDKGAIQNIFITPDPEQNAWRLSFDLLPGDEKLCELRATLMQNDTPLTETWLYRWTA